MCRARRRSSRENQRCDQLTLIVGDRETEPPESEEPLVSDAWQYQLRIYLPDELVDTARFHSDDPALGQIPDILQ